MMKRILVGLTASILAVSCLAATPPKYDHVLLVVLENHGLTQVIGSSSAPYLTSLAAQGASFTNSHGVTHPSQPNYLALFSGSTQGMSDDSCPHTFSGNNLGAQLIGMGYTFSGYSESMPSAGYKGCTSGEYARKHNPWSDFSDLPASVNLQMTSLPSDFSKLPTVSFLVPNLCDDMHDCSVKTGDSWMKTHVDGYAQWAKTHNSLLIVTFDEDDSSTTANLIPTLFIGANVKVGKYSELISHYNVLSTIEAMYSLSKLNSAAAITDVWSTSAVTHAGVDVSGTDGFKVDQQAVDAQ